MGESNFDFDKSTLFFHSGSDKRNSQEAQEVDASFKKHYASKPRRRSSNNDYLDAVLLDKFSQVLNDEAIERYYHLGKHNIDLELQNIAKFNNQFFLDNLTEDAKKAVIEEVTHAYILVMANYRKKLKDGKLTQRPGTKNPEKQRLETALVDCLDILGFLHHGKKLATKPQTTPEEYHKASFYNLWNADQLLRYTGKIITDGLRDTAHNVLNNPTVAAREMLSDINGHRLYWVWSGGLLNSILPFLPDSLNKTRATNEINAPNPITGSLSVILYFARLFINVGVVLKHTISAFKNAKPGKSDKDAKPGALETLGVKLKASGSCFYQQVRSREIVLLNDIVWGTANLLTFVWLTSAKSVKLGNWGTGLTAGLLIFDLALSFAAYRKQHTVYINEKKKVDEKINAYQELIDEKTATTDRLHEQLLGSLNNNEKILAELMNNFGTYLRFLQLAEKNQNLKKHIDELWNRVANLQNEQEVRRQVYHYCANRPDDKVLQEHEELLKDLMATQWIYEYSLRSYSPNIPEEHRKLFTNGLMEYLVNSQELRITQKKLETTIQKRDSIELDWEFSKKEHQNTMIYAASMTVGFSLLLVPIIVAFPPASIVPMVLGLVSAALLFAFTMANTIRTGVINIQKTTKERKINSLQAKGLLIEYKILQLIEKIHKARENNDTEQLELLNEQYAEEIQNLREHMVKRGSLESFRKQVKLYSSKESFLNSLRNDSSLSSKYLKQEKQMRYLEMKQLTADNEYQKQLARYHKINIVRGALIDALIPALVFAATFTMPLGAGIALMAAAAVIGMASRILIDYHFKPKKEDSHRLDEKEFSLFDKAPSLSKLEPKKEKREAHASEEVEYTQFPSKKAKNKPLLSSYRLSYT